MKLILFLVPFSVQYLSILHSIFENSFPANLKQITVYALLMLVFFVIFSFFLVLIFESSKVHFE